MHEAPGAPLPTNNTNVSAQMLQTDPLFPPHSVGWVASGCARAASWGVTFSLSRAKAITLWVSPWYPLRAGTYSFMVMEVNVQGTNQVLSC